VLNEGGAGSSEPAPPLLGIHAAGEPLAHSPRGSAPIPSRPTTI